MKTMLEKVPDDEIIKDIKHLKNKSCEEAKCTENKCGNAYKK